MRLFLAIDLPESVRSRLGELQERLRRSWPGWRWVRPEGIHLTIRFLGEVLPEVDSGARECWREAAAAVAPFKIGFGGIGRFPPRGGARVLWIAVHTQHGSEGLSLLAERVELAARSAGFEEETRPFRAHLTLARAMRGQSPTWSEGIDAGIEESVEVDRLVLFRSTLSPCGARYTALDSFALSGRGREC